MTARNSWHRAGHALKMVPVEDRLTSHWGLVRPNAPEEVAMATGRKVGQLTEPSIANGLIEVRGLEAECVQP